jgi:hypothetical protein
MIDTDKYEGHTPGPWVVLDGMLWRKHANGNLYLMFELEPVPVKEEIDPQLIADAPLLLEEVKRLRRAFHIATGHIGWGNHLGHAELRHALISVGIDADSLPWADREWEEPLPTFGGVAHDD